ncbi:N-acyl homoserine lactonase family protein [Sphingomonas alpina]|uniref:N-acyl homoserine lactonase family protein n=1 Tax=Sphingomonas alpina TaxID=653931 RepID=A0A7H0LKX4_9SPHN|nr:N-acyl homoserine lactonase family protein [Sphingomonas alpina]QNQ10327.1 N-acyl homoserine lactonase family protein [Sphingomonas alpina]
MRIALFAAAAVSLMVQAAPATAAPAPIKLWRLDCGTIAANDLNAFSDAKAYTGKRKDLVGSCYLIKHGDAYLLWDAGLPAAMKGKPLDLKIMMDATLTKTVAEQLAELGLKPENINFLGISHYHFDHIGQAADFPGATLLIGKGDFDAVKAGAPGVNPALLAPWVKGTSKADPVSGDRDVFGDGSVTMIDAPGHTPGHHALLVRLKHGTYLLTGDAAHFQENYDSNGVPAYNSSRPDTLTSLDHIKKLAKDRKATVIIQHEAADVAKLPVFPKAAD